MRYCSIVLLALLVLSCSSDAIEDGNLLSTYIQNKTIVLDNVIACAASNENNALVSVFLYPRPSATNIAYYETVGADLDKNDFDNYSKMDVTPTNVFNGYLLKFEVASSEEKWVIVSFEEGQEIHLSNPIRLKQLSKPTEYLPQNIIVDTSSETAMFSWLDGVHNDTKIYFQVISDQQGDLLSGTYTFEKMFSYYVLDNVVLNITQAAPPQLEQGMTYQFTLMGVSEDNWVNQFSIVDFGP